jgi:hypothetical protein
MNEENLSKLASYSQAKKFCNFKENNENNKKRHGLLYNLVFGQNGGGNIAKDLKNIGKILNNK